MSIKLFLLGGGVFWVIFWGGGVPILFYGREDFSAKYFYVTDVMHYMTITYFYSLIF